MSTQFVLGKNVNEIYDGVKQSLGNETTSSLNMSTSSVSGGGGGGENETSQQQSHESAEPNKSSMYSRYPTLFRYEADQIDRQWLNEQAIIKRKNHKCYLFALDDVVEHFRVSFKFADQRDMFETLNDQSTTTTNSSRDLFINKLKPFSVPDFILFKINRQFYFKTMKNNHTTKS